MFYQVTLSTEPTGRLLKRIQTNPDKLIDSFFQVLLGC